MPTFSTILKIFLIFVALVVFGLFFNTNKVFAAFACGNASTDPVICVSSSPQGAGAVVLYGSDAGKNLGTTPFLYDPTLNGGTTWIQFTKPGYVSAAGVIYSYMKGETVIILNPLCNDGMLVIGELCDPSATPTGCTTGACSSDCKTCGGSTPTTTPTLTSTPTSTISSSPTPSTSATSTPSISSTPVSPPSFSGFGFIPASPSIVETYSSPMNFLSWPDLVSGATGWLLGIAASIILLFIIIGGLFYITSAGNEQRMALAKKIVISALIGFLAVILSVAIIVELKKIL